MPRGDRTGPRAEGPMTGRGLGNCAGNEGQRFNSANQGLGRGRGYFSFGGRGQQLGNRRGFANRSNYDIDQNKQQNLTIWEEIKQMISALTNRIEKLERRENKQ
jgi:hypothetical protein